MSFENSKQTPPSVDEKSPINYAHLADVEKNPVTKLVYLGQSLRTELVARGHSFWGTETNTVFQREFRELDEYKKCGKEDRDKAERILAETFETVLEREKRLGGK